MSANGLEEATPGHKTAKVFAHSLTSISVNVLRIQVFIFCMKKQWTIKLKS